MLFIAPDVVVLDPWAAVAAEYRSFEPPREAFSLPAPYQSTNAAGEIGAGGILNGSFLVGSAAPEAAAPAAEAAEAGEQGRRKRRRCSSYQPNERERQAAARHAKYAPTLAAAAAAVQDWLQGSGACTVHEAVAGVRLSCTQQQHRPEVAEQLPGTNGSGHASSGTAQCGAEADVDYVALYEARHTVRPKLRYVHEPPPTTPAGGNAKAATATAEAAGPRPKCGSSQEVESNQPPELHTRFDRLQDVQQDPGAIQSCNLFDRLISTGGGAGEQLACAAGHAVLLPPRCRFLMSDARRLAPLLEDAAEAGGYHCIVLDPPWENKSVKRSGRYPMLPSRNLLGLPVRQLAHADGCLVALWVTNRERHRRFIDEELLPAWGLRCVATWHWLKMSDSGQPAGRLDIEHRRPYESLLLCWPAHLFLRGPSGADSAAALPAEAAGQQAAAAAADREAAAWGQHPQATKPAPGFHLLPGRELVIAAVPPAEHSRKPHLGELLLPLLPPGARCLEMFARELHSGWTSWGNEVLKLQAASRFVRLKGAGAGLRDAPDVAAEARAAARLVHSP